MVWIEKGTPEYKKEMKKWKKLLKDHATVVDYFLDAQARPVGGVFGEVCISPALLDQIQTLNAVCLEGQAEIIYNIFVYRTAKWHYLSEKADEFIQVTPVAPPAFAPMMAQKERLEGQVKSGMASAAQAVADYELLKHDERKYREVLDYFEMGKKDEHILRSLFIDRVDAYTGDGYSMVTMAKRWPTIISDFIKMKSKWDDVTMIRKELRVSQAEATILKTKNELFKEWKKLFFPDVRDRYVRIKNLLESRKRSIHEYREWLKPYLNRLKMIREEAEISNIASEITEITQMSFTPQGQVHAKLWFWKMIQPEQVGKEMVIQGWGEIPIFDDWVKENLILLEAKYDPIEMSYKDIKKFLKGAQEGPTGSLMRKQMETLARYPAAPIDPRGTYYSFIDMDYRCQYKKGSTGPMVVEDQYWDFHPFVISKNFLLYMLLELEFKKKKFAHEISKLIGVTEEEELIREDVEKEWTSEEEDREKEKEKKKRSKILPSVNKHKWIRRRRVLKNRLKPLLKLVIKPGPYEINIAERITKSYGLYFGAEIAELRDLIKETSYRISGQRP